MCLSSHMCVVPYVCCQIWACRHEVWRAEVVFAAASPVTGAPGSKSI